MGEHLGVPLIITIVAVLWASGVGRNLQIAWFVDELSTREQRACAAAALAAAALLGFLALRYGTVEAWQAPLFVAVIACAVLRRAAPVEIRLRWFSTLGWLGFFALFRGFGYIFEMSSAGKPDSGEVSVDGLIISGSLFFLAGVGIAAVRVLKNLQGRTA